MRPCSDLILHRSGVGDPGRGVEDFEAHEGAVFVVVEDWLGRSWRVSVSRWRNGMVSWRPPVSGDSAGLIDGDPLRQLAVCNNDDPDQVAGDHRLG